jgi:hypothetical protein
LRDIEPLQEEFAASIRIDDWPIFRDCINGLEPRSSFGSWSPKRRNEEHDVPIVEQEDSSSSREGRGDECDGARKWAFSHVSLGFGAFWVVSPHPFAPHSDNVVRSPDSCSKGSGSVWWFALSVKAKEDWLIVRCVSELDTAVVLILVPSNLHEVRLLSAGPICLSFKEPTTSALNDNELLDADGISTVRGMQFPRVNANCPELVWKGRPRMFTYTNVDPWPTATEPWPTFAEPHGLT